MRACIQRVTKGRVLLQDEENRTSGEIGKGFVVLLGVGQNDTADEARLLARKIARLRVFDDEAGKMNLDIKQIGGSILAVSQFTLYADAVHGNRPGFTEAAPPDQANRLYEEFIKFLRSEENIPVETGVFRTMMSVELINDGPVTIWLDTADFKSKKQ